MASSKEGSSSAIFAHNDEALRVLGNSMRVFENFISEAEETSMVKEVTPNLKRLRYESAHWDNVSEQYACHGVFINVRILLGHRCLS